MLVEGVAIRHPGHVVRHGPSLPIQREARHHPGREERGVVAVDVEEIPVRVRFQEKDRESLTELHDFLVPTYSGGLLPLRAVTDAQFLPTPETIVRRNKRTGRSIPRRPR